MTMRKTIRQRVKRINDSDELLAMPSIPVPACHGLCQLTITPPSQFGVFSADPDCKMHGWLGGVLEDTFMRTPDEYLLMIVEHSQQAVDAATWHFNITDGVIDAEPGPHTEWHES